MRAYGKDSSWAGMSRLAAAASGPLGARRVGFRLGLGIRDSVDAGDTGLGLE